MGRNLCIALGKRNKIKVLSRHKPEWADNLGISWIEGNILSFESIQKAVSAGVDTIIDLVGLIDQKEQKHHDVNVNGTANLVKAIAGQDDIKLVYISAIGSDKGGTEYFNTKRAAEENVKQHENHVIIRPSLLYGEDDHIVAQLLSMAGGFVPAIPKSGFLNPVYVGDFSKVVEKLLEAKGEFDVCSNEKLRLGDMLNIVRGKQGKKPIPQLPIKLFYLAIPLLSALNIISKEQLTMLGYDLFRVDTVLYKCVTKPIKFSDFVSEHIGKLS